MYGLIPRNFAELAEAVQIDFWCYNLDNICVYSVTWKLFTISNHQNKFINPLSAKIKMHLKMSSAEVVCCK